MGHTLMAADLPHMLQSQKKLKARREVHDFNDFVQIIKSSCNNMEVDVLEREPHLIPTKGQPLNKTCTVQRENHGITSPQT